MKDLYLIMVIGGFAIAIGWLPLLDEWTPFFWKSSKTVSIIATVIAIIGLLLMYLT